MKLKKYKKIYSEDDAPGWQAIDEALVSLYPDQEPEHRAATPHYAAGGEDPIDGISYYRAYHNGELYYHFVSYGFSSLYYDEDSVGEEYSNFGFELTFRLKPYHLDKDGPNWVFSLIQNLARYVFSSGNWFEPYQYLSVNGPIRLETDTDLSAIVFVPDPELGEINTPHGMVQFIQMFAISGAEYEDLVSGEKDVLTLLEQYQQSNPLLITDLAGG